MGCVPSKDASTTTEIFIKKKTPKASFIETIEDYEEQPISQDNSLSSSPINVPGNYENEDEKLLITSYIKSCKNWRNEHGCQSEMKLSKMIVIGAFIQSNYIFKKYEILGIGMELNQIFENISSQIQPDLMLLNLETKQLIDVEIGRNSNIEEMRNIFINNDYKLVRFNPKSYENSVEMATAFTQFLNSMDGIYFISS